MSDEDVINVGDMTVEELMESLGVSRSQAEDLLAIEQGAWADDVQEVPDDQAADEEYQEAAETLKNWGVSLTVGLEAVYSHVYELLTEMAVDPDWVFHFADCRYFDAEDNVRIYFFKLEKDSKYRPCPLCAVERVARFRERREATRRAADAAQRGKFYPE